MGFEFPPRHVLVESPDDDRLSRKVMHRLLDDIRLGRHPVGSRLPPERELASRIGVSRPVVREAIMALDLLGMVGSRVGSGTYVIRDAAPPFVMLPRTSPFELTDAIRTTEASIVPAMCQNIKPGQILEFEREAALLDEDVLGFSAWHERLALIHLGLARASANVTMAAVLSQLWQARTAHEELAEMLDDARRRGALRMALLFGTLFDALRERDPDGAGRALGACHHASMSAILDVYAARQIEAANRNVAEMRNLYGR